MTFKDYYQLPAIKLMEIFDTSIEGLKESEAKKRIEQFGYNELTIKEDNIFIKSLKLFLKSFLNMISYLLIACALISVFLSRFSEAFFIVIIIIINAIIQTYEGLRSEREIKILKKLAETKPRVKRDGKIIEIESKYLVPGDIVLIKEGDKIPADGRLIESRGLEVDESLFTGGSLPTQKIAAVIKTAKNIHEMKNLIFNGTLVTRGSALALILATGDQTYFGKLAKETKEIKEEEPLVEHQLKSLITIIGVIGIIATLIIFILNIERTKEFYSSFLFSLATLVAMIPEGLIVVISLLLIISARDLAKKNIITRNISKILDLAATQVLALDKTGTITENKMVARKIYQGGAFFDITGGPFEKKGLFIKSETIIDPQESKYLHKLLQICILNTDVTSSEHEDTIEAYGDPTEIALFILAKKAGLEEEKVFLNAKKLDELAFTPLKKFRVNLYEIIKKGKKVKELYLTGAFEEVLRHSNHIIIGDKSLPLNSKRREELSKVVSELESKYRTVAFAYKSNVKESFINEEKLKDFTLIGIVMIYDPPRKRVKETIQDLKNQNIEIKMVTGDSFETAKNIGEEIGLTEEKEEAITLGSDIEGLKASELREKVNKNKIFARLNPLQKLEITRSVIMNSQKIAMTGDGVNDVPSLKKANVGIVMGLIGTQAAKEAADFIITDDNFESISYAIIKARSCFENLKKTVVYLLSTNFGELFAILLFTILNLGLPLTPLQILWINLITDGLNVYPLLKEPPEKELRKKTQKYFASNILSKNEYYLISFGAIVFVVLVILTKKIFSFESSRLQTVIFEVFIFCQLFNIFNLKSLWGSILKIPVFGNSLLIIIFLISVAISIALPYTDFGKIFLGLTPLNNYDWFKIIGISFLTIPLMELFKLIFRVSRDRKYFIFSNKTE